MSEHPLWRRLLAELLGSAFLAAIVIGSGIAAQQLSPGRRRAPAVRERRRDRRRTVRHHLDVRPGLGGHFNPVVSFVDAAFGGLRWRHALAYLPAQVAGCVGGAVVANLMFAEPAVSISTKHRASAAHFLSEVVATLGLLLVIFALARTGRSRISPGRGGCLHRRGLLLHQLDHLRQPGHHVRAHVLQHFRRHRSLLGTDLHRRPSGRRGVSRSLVIKALYPEFDPSRGLRRRLPPSLDAGGDPVERHKTGLDLAASGSPAHPKESS